MNWILFFWIVLKSVLFSTGGFGPLPSLHADFIARGWATERTFTEALAIGQLTPGPNGLWVASLCYLIGGVPGAALSCLAMLAPPLLILLVELVYLRIAGKSATQGALDGVVLAIVGSNLFILAQMFLGWQLDWTVMAIAALSAVAAATRKVPPILVIAAAIAVGYAIG
jgi:chromate transporter